eukprot:m.119968 g.119968  ORF g.119968 m.119968 type:complete len:345 (+) comp28778_c0_seq3:184-1218(+)
MGVWINVWLCVVAGVWFCAPSPGWIMLGLGVLHTIMWVLLVGGFESLKEVCEAHIQPKLPSTQSTRELGNKSMLVVGAYSGLGEAVCMLVREQARYVRIDQADVMLSGDEHLDLCSLPSIQEFAARYANQTLDVLVLCAGVCDSLSSPPFPRGEALLPRMAWVNFLGDAVLVQALQQNNCVIHRIVVVGSGAYARGSQRAWGGQLFPRQWSPLQTLSVYSQSKFVLTAWACWLRRVKHIDVVILNPGPMRSTIGDRQVPFALWPTYGLMKEVLFPLPKQAANSVMMLALAAQDTAPDRNSQRCPYMHIRRMAKLSQEVESEDVQRWVVSEMEKALHAAGYQHNL